MVVKEEGKSCLLNFFICGVKQFLFVCLFSSDLFSLIMFSSWVCFHLSRIELTRDWCSNLNYLCLKRAGGN
jgi:hypothetical protein